MGCNFGQGNIPGVLAALAEMHVFTIREGKVVRFDEYLDTASAIAAYR